MNTTQLSQLSQRKYDKTGKHLSLAELKQLYALSCGYIMALRSCGNGTGDPLYMDALYGNMEVQRYAREIYNHELKAWWHEVLA